MTHHVRTWILLTAVVAVSTALGTSAAPAPVPDLRSGPVFVIIGENLNYHDISEKSRRTSRESVARRLV